jgi:DNA polymerase-1
MLAKMGVDIGRQRVRDTRVMAHILQPNSSTALKNLAVRYVDPQAKELQDNLVLGEPGKGWTWATVPLTYEPYWTYAALDPVLTSGLADELEPRVMAEAPYAFEVENNVAWVTNQMERRGVAVDVAYAEEHRRSFEAYCIKVETWCKSRYGVSPGSNQAIVRVLQDAGWEFTKATASGAVSLDKEVLEGIDHPLAQVVLKRRQLQKLSSTYLTHYIEESIDGIIHPSINSLGARTSRMSMSGPNFQNLPVASERNPGATVIRNCVVRRPRHTLLFCDFDQIEMRILTHLTRSVGLITAFNSPDDFFINLARVVYNDPTLSDKKDKRRRTVKNYGYATIYGAGLAKLAVTAGVPYEQIVQVKKGWDAAYPEVADYQDAVFREAMRTKSETGVGYAVCPLTGRRHPADPGKEYALVNYLIQGVAAAAFKIKLLELDAAGLGRWMVAPVHDEIILDVPNEHVVEAVHILESVMNDRDMFSVPISASASFGHRWGEKQDWDEDLWRASLSR